MNTGFFGYPTSAIEPMFNPDIPPSNPNPMNDEFTGSSLDPKWTVWNLPAGGSVTVANSMATLVSPYNIQARVFAILQPTPTGTWKFRTKQFHDCAHGNYWGFGLVVRRITGSDKSLSCFNLCHSGQGIAVQTIWGHRLAGTAWSADYDLYNLQTMKWYMEVEYDLTNIIFRISHTGNVYTRIWSVDAATWPGGAPEWVGIHCHNYSNHTTDANWSGAGSCDWFRRVA